MKREWILGLATAAGMSLLAAMPGFGGDTTVTNNKKPTEVKKPAVSTAKPATTNHKLSVKSDKPVVQNKKTAEKKVQTTSKVTPSKATSKPMANVKTATIAKPSFKINPHITIGSQAKSNPVSNAKPAPAVKSHMTQKTVSTAKPAIAAKPKMETKTVTASKPVVNAKQTPASVKPVQKSNVKPASNSKPVTMNKPIAPVKMAVQTKPVQTKPVQKAKPVVINKPIVNAKPAVHSKSIVSAKPVVNTKPVIYTKPAVSTKPVLNTKPAVKTIKSQPQAAKSMPVSKPVVAATPKKIESKAAPKKESASWKLPAQYERLNLTNDQREKASAIWGRYDGQINKLEATLKSLKADRERELTALFKVQPKPAVTSVKKADIKPAMKIQQPTKPVISNGKKAETTKRIAPKPVEKMASAAPVLKDKSPSKTALKK